MVKILLIPKKKITEAYVGSTLNIYLGAFCESEYTIVSFSMFEKYLPKFINIIKFPYTANSNEKNSKYSSYGSFLLFAEAHLGRIQTSVMERFCKNSEQLLAVDNSCLKASSFLFDQSHPANIYMFKTNNGNNRKRSEYVKS